MPEAAAQYVQSLKKPIPVLACHQHFLSDIGKDLLEAGHHQLRDGFRQIRLLPRLRAFVRQQGSHLGRSEEHTSELQSRLHLVCRLLLEKKKKKHSEIESSRTTVAVTATIAYYSS